jgi:Zn-dependent oligopeptidase
MSRTIPALLSLAIFTACGPGTSQPPASPKVLPAQTKPTAPAAAEAKPLLAEPEIWDSVAQIEKVCGELLAKAETIRAQIKQVKGAHQQQNTLVPYNELLLQLDRLLPRSELFANVHPDKKVRTAAEACEKRGKKLQAALKLDRGLYNAIKAVPAAGLDPAAARFREHLLRDYRRAGVDRDDAVRAKLAKLDELRVSLGQKFARNLREGRLSVEVAERELAGMPADWLAAKKKAAKGGKIKLTTDYTDFYPVQSYAKREALRRQLYKLYLSRAFPQNEVLLKQLLQARHDTATTLGYPDWAEYMAEDKMVKRKQVVAEFIDKVSKLARPKMKADLKQILTRKRKDSRRARSVNAWDRFYYVNRIKAERYGVDQAEVRAYFNFPGVKAGLLALAQDLFGLTFKRAAAAKVWHESVEAYDVLDGGQRVARFYLDLHPREGKYGHAAEFALVSGLEGTQLPAAALVTNFPDPKKGALALTEHGQVTVFFHEFGHLMHQLLARRHRWVPQSGITCEWDFVEAPSQLLEEWSWDPAVLARFAKHHKTGKPIPPELVKRMLAAKEFGKGVHVMRQMFYAALSFNFHNRDPRKLAPKKLLGEIQRRYSPYPYQPGTAVYCNFGHLNGYSSMYYTYMWSKVLAKDLFTRFEAKGLLHKPTSMAYRKAILEPGGARDAAQMVKDFLGRPYSFEAYRAWLAR